MAGGCGTRGRPYTEFIPKSAIPVNGRPVIAHVAEYLASLPEISEIIILSDFTGLGGQIRNYFGSSKVNGKRIKFIQDSQSGTGGDLLHLRPHLKAGNFILWFADNICAVDAASCCKKSLRYNISFYVCKSCLFFSRGAHRNACKCLCHFQGMQHGGSINCADIVCKPQYEITCL